MALALVLVTAPAVEPIDLATAKTHLREDGTHNDALIADLITVAREYCEDYQNRAYITQTWEMWLDSFPSEDYISIPLPPLQSVTSVKYYGNDNVEYTMAAADYFVDNKSKPGRLVLADGKSWPSVTLRPANAVCVEFKAGYGDDAGKVPQKVKDAMIMHIQLRYDDYRPEERQKMEEARDRLLRRDRVAPQ